MFFSGEKRKFEEPEDEEVIPEPQPRPDHLKLKIKETLQIAARQLVKTMYELEVPIAMEESDSLHCETVPQLLQFINESSPKSLYRSEIVGIINEANNELIPFNNITNTLPSGNYKVQFITSSLTDDQLQDMLDTAVQQLKQQRAMKSNEITELEANLLTSVFTHASLTQEGSTITLREVVTLAEALKQVDVLHQFSDSEVKALINLTTCSEIEVVEAINHIQVSKQLHSLSKKDHLDEVTVLELHRQLMSRLLVNPSEGIAGEYRKVGVAIHNSTVPRVLSSDVPEKMKALFVSLERGLHEGEHITQFLARIHSEFQLIHPFCDGNGRIGRLIMNTLAMKEGYPIIFYTPEQRNLFNKACEQAHLGKQVLFRRMLLESMYGSLKEYEQVFPSLLQNVAN